MPLMTPTRRRILSNLLSLSSVEAISYLFPLVTIPYLVRVLGPGKFGLVSFAQAFAQYFSMLASFSFALTATRAVSLARHKPEELSRIYSNVLGTSSTLAAFSTVVAVVMALTIPPLREHWLILLLSLGAVWGKVLFPAWFFLGMEKMSFVAWPHLLLRGISTALIFLIVRSENDYYLVLLCPVAGWIVSDLFTLIVARFQFGMRFHMPGLGVMVRELRRGLLVFAGMMSAILNVPSAVFVVGLFAEEKQVGFFAAPQKLIVAAMMLFRVFGRTVYPHVSRLAKENPERAIAFLGRAFGVLLVMSVGATLVMLAASGFVVNLVFGSQYESSVPVLKVLSLMFVLFALNDLFGTQTLLAFGANRLYAFCNVVPSVLNFGLLFVVVPRFGIIGAATLLVCTSALMLLLCLIGLYAWHRPVLAGILRHTFSLAGLRRRLTGPDDTDDAPPQMGPGPKHP